MTSPPSFQSINSHVSVLPITCGRQPSLDSFSTGSSLRCCSHIPLSCSCGRRLCFRWFLQLASFLDWCLCSFASGTGIPLSFLLYYYPLYQAAERSQSFGDGIWHFHICCAILWSLVTLSGLPVVGIASPSSTHAPSCSIRSHLCRNLECTVSLASWIRSSGAGFLCQHAPLAHSFRPAVTHLVGCLASSVTSSFSSLYWMT